MIRIENVQKAADLAKARDDLKKFAEQIDGGANGFTIQLRGNTPHMNTELPWEDAKRAIEWRVQDIEREMEALGVDLSEMVEPVPELSDIPF